MAIFEDVTLGWKGTEYVVDSSKVMRLIAKVENEITLQELITSPKMTSLAFAYSAALNYAGASVNPDEVYEALFTKDSSVKISDAVGALLVVMMPPSTYQPPSGKPQAKTRKKK